MNRLYLGQVAAVDMGHGISMAQLRAVLARINLACKAPV